MAAEAGNVPTLRLAPSLSVKTCVGVGFGSAIRLGFSSATCLVLGLLLSKNALLGVFGRGICYVCVTNITAQDTYKTNRMEEGAQNPALPAENTQGAAVPAAQPLAPQPAPIEEIIEIDDQNFDFSSIYNKPEGQAGAEATPVIEPWKVYSEKLGIVAADETEFIAAASRAKVVQPTAGLSPSVRRIQKLVEKGDFEQAKTYIGIAAMKPDTLTPTEILLYRYGVEHPDAEDPSTEDLIKFAKHECGMDLSSFENIDDIETQAPKGYDGIQLKASLATQRGKIKDMIKNYLEAPYEDEGTMLTPEQVAAFEAQKTASTAQIVEFLKNGTLAVIKQENGTELKIKLSDVVPANYQYTDQDVNVEEVLMGIGGLGSVYTPNFAPSDKVDIAKVAEAAHLLKNKEAIFQKIYQAGLSAGASKAAAQIETQINKNPAAMPSNSNSEGKAEEIEVVNW